MTRHLFCWYRACLYGAWPGARPALGPGPGFMITISSFFHHVSNAQSMTRMFMTTISCFFDHVNNARGHPLIMSTMHSIWLVYLRKSILNGLHLVGPWIHDHHIILLWSCQQCTTSSFFNHVNNAQYLTRIPFTYWWWWYCLRHYTLLIY